MPAHTFERTVAGLRLRLLFIILILLAPLAAFIVAGLVQVRTTRIQITQQRAYEFAQAGAARYQDTVDDIRSVLTLLARTSEVVAASPESCQQFLTETIRSHSWARSFSVADLNNRIVCSTLQQAIGFDLSERDWFKQAQEQGEFAVSNFQVAQVTGAATTFAVFFHPSPATGQKIALLASLDLGWFDRLSKTIGEKDDALVMLVDSKGVILSRFPVSSQGYERRIASNQFAEDVISRKEGWLRARDPDGVERLFGIVDLKSTKDRVIVGFNYRSTVALIDKYTGFAAVIFIGLSALASVIVFFAGDRIFIRPIEALNGVLKMTLNTMDQGLIFVNRHGHYALCNDRAIKLLDLPPELVARRPHRDEILEFQKTHGEYTKTPDRILDKIRATYTEPSYDKYIRERPNGVFLEVTTLPVEGGGFVRTFSDVTEKLSSEAEMQREKERAESSARAATEFLANMSHELRTPLTAIIGVSELLLDPSTSVSRQQNFIELQREAGKGLLSVINDILDFSKIEAGQLVLETAPFSVHDLAQSCVRVLSEEAARQGLTILFEADSNVPEWILGDEGRLRQVLSNLLANSVKFSSTGIVKLKVTAVSQDVLRFAVTDDGIGIEPEDIPRLFERFNQGETGTTRRFGGTGLGLAISQRLVGLMGGRIAVSSRKGIGSTFSFELGLPACPPPASSLLISAGQSAVQPLRILLAEDNHVNRELIVHMLMKQGHSVVPVSDGDQAVAAFQNHIFDAVIMDIQMPIKDGYQATQAIRQFSNIPIIALSANALSGEAERSLAAGMDAHVTKPVVWTQLFSKLEELASLHREGTSDEQDEQSSLSRERPHDALSTRTLFELHASLGDSKLQRLLALFAADLSEKSFREPEDVLQRKTVAELAHSLAGSASMLGFVEVASSCQLIYKAAGSDKLLLKEIAVFEAARQTALRELAEIEGRGLADYLGSRSA